MPDLRDSLKKAVKAQENALRVTTAETQPPTKEKQKEVDSGTAKR